MNGQVAYVITGRLALVVWILALVGAITVFKAAIRIVLKILRYSPQQKMGEEKHQNTEYIQSTYYLATKNKYDDVLQDKGLYGEYKIFRVLQPFENQGARFLFNCYLPREHNETTEVDVILLTHNGIFIFESKNYNGWIFGSEDQDLWTQTLPAGNKIHKSHFYNPIRQNKTHIKYLKKVIGDNLPIYSMIVFSDDCTLKEIAVTDLETKVIYLSQAFRAVSELSMKTLNSISQENLVLIYDKLYPYTQVSDSIKQEHIDTINEKIKM